MNDEDKERFENAWKSKWDDLEHMIARDSDHLLTQFECDLCIFLKLTKRYPLSKSLKDRKLVACILRINLDAF